MMITETKTLSCKFKDTLGANRTLSIDAPKANLTPEEIAEFMHFVIDSNLLVTGSENNESQLALINGASLVHRVTETIELN